MAKTNNAGQRKVVDLAVARLGKIAQSRIKELQRTGTCAICGKSGKDRLLARDHHHVSGRFRDLLCLKCNLAIGLIGDDPDRARKIAEYLERPPTIDEDELIDFAK